MRYLWLFFTLFIGVSHSLQTYVDEKRFARKQNTTWYYLLTFSNEYYFTVKVLSLRTFLATNLFTLCRLWNNCTRDDALWLYSMIETISYLDPLRTIT